MRLRPLSRDAGSLEVDIAVDSERRNSNAESKPSRFLRIDLVAGELDISTSTVYSHVVQKIFPPPVKIGTASVWVRTEIDAYQAAVIGGASRAELEKLVESLIASRKGVPSNRHKFTSSEN